MHVSHCYFISYCGRTGDPNGAPQTQVCLCVRTWKSCCSCSDGILGAMLGCRVWGRQASKCVFSVYFVGLVHVGKLSKLSLLPREKLDFYIAWNFSLSFWVLGFCPRSCVLCSLPGVWVWLILPVRWGWKGPWASGRLSWSGHQGGEQALFLCGRCPATATHAAVRVEGWKQN